MSVKSSSFRQAFQYLKIAMLHFEDQVREAPTAKSAKYCYKYRDKIEWIFSDFKTNTSFPVDVTASLIADLNGDVLIKESLRLKLKQLPEAVQENLEAILDELLKGEEIKLEATQKEAHENS